MGLTRAHQGDSESVRRAGAEGTRRVVEWGGPDNNAWSLTEPGLAAGPSRALAKTLCVGSHVENRQLSQPQIHPPALTPELRARSTWHTDRSKAAMICTFL